MLFGNARVSTDDQNLDLQHAALNAAGCGKIFEDRITGTARKRTGLTRARSKAAPPATCGLSGGLTASVGRSAI
jgi:DNA invertase Pin-like site-specific DNA recombinase